MRPPGKSTTGTTVRIATRLLARAGKGKEVSRGKLPRSTSPLVGDKRVCGRTVDERVSRKLSPGDHTSSKIWPRGIRFFRGYNPCFTPYLTTTGAQESCTKFRKDLSPFRPTFRLRSTSSLLRSLLLEHRLPGRGPRPRILCSSTLTKFRNMVRFCLFIHQVIWRIDYRFSVIPQSALCGRLVTCPTRDHRVIGFPVEMPGKYYRNYLRFNVCFVFNRSADLSCYEPVVRKVSRVLTSCEVRWSARCRLCVYGPSNVRKNLDSFPIPRRRRRSMRSLSSFTKT